MGCSIEGRWKPLVKYLYYLGVRRDGMRRILTVKPMIFCVDLETTIAPKVGILQMYNDYTNSKYIFIPSKSLSILGPLAYRGGKMSMKFDPSMKFGLTTNSLKYFCWYSEALLMRTFFPSEGTIFTGYRHSWRSNWWSIGQIPTLTNIQPLQKDSTSGQSSFNFSFSFSFLLLLMVFQFTSSAPAYSCLWQIEISFLFIYFHLSFVYDIFNM